MTAPAAVSVRVRRARRTDWPRMAALDRELARFEKLPPPTAAEARRLGALLFDRREIEAFVAEVGGRIEGMAIFWEGLGSSFRVRPFLFLEDLVVSASARSRGVGEALMAALAREGMARKVLRIDWVALDWNEGAIRFYHRIGAAPQKEWVRYSLAEDGIRKLAREAPRPAPKIARVRRPSTRSARPRDL